MKTTKLYNMILPIWLLILVPTAWLVVIPVNFLIDSGVLLLLCYFLKLNNKRNIYVKSILKVWMLGFAADFIGAFLMIAGAFVIFNDENSVVGEALRMNVFHNYIALIWTVISVIVAGVLIYIFDKKIAFSKTDLSEKSKRKLSIGMAIITAPYIFFIPTEWLLKFYE